MKVFSERIKQLRIENNMKQKELASLIYVSRPTVAGYETKNRNPEYSILVAIADVFNVTTDYLLGRTDDPH